ncbi:MAG TPA: exopolyphosphatase [Burkholderiales bacterium]|jgi:exopolyphosphatase/guanosine-5'-triphosphate,3'-diphosphate pyrophosphatase|nr:exopolyphosphatase [Burkholderiales bacterium]
MAAMETFSTIAAVDLGSNSFRLQVGRVVDDQIYPLDSLREPVRLAAGLTPDKHLDESAQARAIEALKRFGERLRGLPPGAVRAVGTNTLRVARNARDFMPRFEAALGFPIEVVAGREEARLIYLGVAHSLPASTETRLVVDIGGGSTEFIIGAGNQPHRLESLYMGCVSYSLRYFAGGKVGKSDMKQAETAARVEIEAIKRQFSRKHWSQAVGSSGTAGAIADILEASGWSASGITRDGIEKLRSALIKAGDTARLDLAGLKEDRIAVLPGGFAIMSAIFSELDVEHMALAGGAMRQGILWDMIGRAHRRDMRELTVRQFVKRYHVDAAHAHRVERLALRLYEQLAEGGRQDHEYPMQMLSWAARLQEIGLTVAHSGYHKHSAYIVANADMPGFSKMEQSQLSMMVLAHRGSLSKLRGLVRQDHDWSLLVALRLAALLNRSRSDLRLPAIRASRRKAAFTVDIDARWLAANPLTATELRDEVHEWRGLGIELAVPGLAELDPAPESIGAN